MVDERIAPATMREANRLYKAARAGVFRDYKLFPLVLDEYNLIRCYKVARHFSTGDRERSLAPEDWEVFAQGQPCTHDVAIRVFEKFLPGSDKINPDHPLHDYYGFGEIINIVEDMVEMLPPHVFNEVARYLEPLVRIIQSEREYGK